MGSATTPFSSPFTDLSAAMEPAFQLLDVASRQIRMARETGGFYRLPAVLAAVNQLEQDLNRIIAANHRGHGKDSEPEQPANGLIEEGDLEGAPMDMEADESRGE